MKPPPDLIYGKFKIDPDNQFAAEFMFSTDRSHIAAWGGIPKETAPPSGELIEPPTTFKQLSRSFMKSKDSYSTTFPVLRAFTPMIRNIILDRELRRFAKNNGALVETKDNMETYKLPFSTIDEITKRVGAHAAIVSGLSGLPNLFLMGLVSSYDAFFSQLLRAIIIARPEIISSSDRSISLRDLLEIGSVEAARERLIDREIDVAMRMSHAEQIGWIEKRLKIDIATNNKDWPLYIEIFERRNLLTHTAGVVSAQYLSVCKEHGVDVTNVKLGENKYVTSRYLRESIDLLTEFGVKLIQVVWRKMMPNDACDAAEELGGVGYDLIRRRRYKLAARLLKFGLEEVRSHGTDALKKRMVINYANAEKLSGDKDEAQRILASEDWSAVTINYEICIAAIKDDVDGVVRLMKSASSAEKGVGIDDFREWPVFETIRSNPKFVGEFEAVFGEPLFRDTDTKRPTDEGEAETPSGS